MSHISSDIYWYLRYISDISCLGRFVRWIRRSCNDVMVLDVDLGVILGMTGYLDIRKVGRSQPTKRGPLWHGTWWKFKGRMSRQDWERLALNLAGGFQPHGYPQSIHVNKMFHYKPLINHPAIWGYPFFRKPPSVEHPSHLLGWKVSNSMIKLSTHQSRIQSLDKEVSQPMISQSTNQSVNPPGNHQSINPPGKSDHVDFKQLLRALPCVFFKHSQVRNPCRAAGILHHRYLQLPLPSAQLWYFWPVGAMEKCHGTATSELTASTFLKKWQRNLARTWICLRLPPPPKKNTSVFIIDSPFQTRMSNWENWNVTSSKPHPKSKLPLPPRLW